METTNVPLKSPRMQYGSVTHEVTQLGGDDERDGVDGRISRKGNDALESGLFVQSVQMRR